MRGDASGGATHSYRDHRPIDQCRARGCGGLLHDVGSTVFDGEITYCRSCGREHTFHVPFDDGPVRVVPERKPKKAR